MIPQLHGIDPARGHLVRHASTVIDQDRARRLITRSAATLREAGALLVPVWCSVCGAFGASLCERCRQGLRRIVAPQSEVFETGGGAPIPLATASHYDGVLRTLLSAFKEQGRLDAARPLAALLRLAFEELSIPRELSRHAEGGVVPIALPSRVQAVQRRGYRHLDIVCREGLGVRVDAGLLRLERTARDQAGLSRREREVNMQGAMRANSRLNERAVLLIDDVVTSGASLREAVRAVRAASGIPIGSIAIARAVRAVPVRNSREMSAEKPFPITM